MAATLPAATALLESANALGSPNWLQIHLMVPNYVQIQCVGSILLQVGLDLRMHLHLTNGDRMLTDPMGKFKYLQMALCQTE